MNEDTVGYEYRVLWRREHDKKTRTRLYQTKTGAESFASFIEGATWDEYPVEDSILAKNLERLGNTTSVWIEQRPVGVWMEAKSD